MSSQLSCKASPSDSYAEFMSPARGNTWFFRVRPQFKDFEHFLQKSLESLQKTVNNHCETCRWETQLSVPRHSRGAQLRHCNHRSELLLHRLHARPWRIQASPHDRHCTFQHSVSVGHKENKSAKSPRRSDQDISILVLSGRGETAAHSPKA